MNDETPNQISQAELNSKWTVSGNEREKELGIFTYIELLGFGEKRNIFLTSANAVAVVGHKQCLRLIGIL